jgi:hypothetical protein
MGYCNCRTTRRRPAPNVARTPNSWLRAAARASSRLAALPQATRSTQQTAPGSRHRSGRTGPTMVSRKFSTTPVNPRIAVLCNLSSWGSIALISLCAAARETSGRRRNDVEAGGIAIRGLLRRERKRGPDVRLRCVAAAVGKLIGGWVCESRRHDTDDAICIPVQRDGLAEHITAAGLTICEVHNAW